VVLRLPAAASAGSQDAVAEQAAITRAAILRYCTERMAANQDARRLAMAAARRELLIAAVVTAVAILMLTWFAFRQPEGLWSYVLALATIFAVFAASLTIWDALESWFFDWTPFAVDNAAYRWISHLQVRIAPATAEDTQKEPAT
jgi:phosphatidylglycerophosphate synthase